MRLVRSFDKRQLIYRRDRRERVETGLNRIRTDTISLTPRSRRRNLTPAKKDCPGMRRPRLKLRNCSAVYNCVCRVVGNEYLLYTEEEKEIVRIMIRKLEDFCGVGIVFYSVMSNHFHVEVRVPALAPVSDDELAWRVRNLYTPEDPLRKAVEEDLQKRGHLAESLRQRLLARMGDLSMYFKELKQRLTRSYNARHDNRIGTLWSDRFKSMLVEDNDRVIRTVAAYLDLNSLRAGIVDDPKDYRFCGYTEAL